MFDATIAAFCAKVKLADPAVTGAPEDQRSAPLEDLFTALAEPAGLLRRGITLAGESTLASLGTRP